VIDDGATDWRSNVLTALIALMITIIGGSLVCLSWMRELQEPSVTFLGSGSDLSVLVSDGPARILLATGDDPIAFENAFLATQPLFARRIDLLLISGDAASLRVPEAARNATLPRQIAAVGELPPSPELEVMQPMEVLSGHRHIRLSGGTSIWIETQMPVGADPLDTTEEWRLSIDHGGTRIVVYSDGQSVPLFPPQRPASIVAVAGSDPLTFLTEGDGSVFVANATRIGGPELRESISAPDADTSWIVRIHPGDAVRMELTPEGVAVPAWAAMEIQERS
jgi:hypothetical protein